MLKRVKSQRESRLRHCEDRPQELLGTFGTCDSDGECPHPRLRSQFEPQEGQHSRSATIRSATSANHLFSPGMRKAYPFSNFLGCSKSGPELSEKCCFPLAKLCVSQAARYRIIIRHSEPPLSRNRLFLPTNSQVTLSIADALQETRKLAKSADCVGGANILGRECFISTAVRASA